jgi:1-acyl-sn-glycerol-3-phosphate acyltransferase
MLYLIRIIVTILYIGIICFIGILVGMARPFNPKNVKLICEFLSFGLPLLGVKIVVHNKEILELLGPFVFLSNHQHNFDIFPGSYLIPKQTVSIGKKSIKYIPFFGQFYWLSGNILIDRSNKKNAFSTLDQTVKSIQDQKFSVWIMPEGTRSNGRGLLPFKKGPFVTAIKAQIPIVPIVISSYVGKLNFNKWHAGTITVQVLPPINTVGLKLEDAGTIKDKTFDLMKSTLQKIDHE